VPDGVLAPLLQELASDDAIPVGASVDLLSHPVYGHDLGYSFCLEFCPHRIAHLNLSEAQRLFNLWFRCERYVRLYDAIEETYSDGDHQRATDLLTYSVWEAAPEAVIMEVQRRIEHEVGEMLSRYAN
jgi:hypothetical protein